MEKNASPAEVEKFQTESELNRVKTRQLELEVASLERCEKTELSGAEYARSYSFYDPVNSNTVKSAMKELGAWSRREPKSEIKIVFSSPGGNVIDGFALYDFIQELKNDGHVVTTVGLGWAASMGGILLQAGTTRIMGANAFMLIHEIAAGNIGKTSEMEDELKFIKRLQQKSLSILSERANLSVRQIERRWKRKDWWLDSAECLRYGFIDEIRYLNGNNGNTPTP